MFKAKTNKIEMLTGYFMKRIKALEKLFSGIVNMYIDYANIRPWSAKLGWNIDQIKNNIDTFVLWSGDSDFAEPIEKLLDNGK